MTEDNEPLSESSAAWAQQLAAWLREAEREIAEIQAAVEPLQRRLEVANERRDLLRRLAHLTGDIGASQEGARPDGAASDGAALHGTSSLEDAIESILEQAGKPLHISEIRETLVEAGVPLPGRGDQANIIVRLRRDESRFTRTERGTYALASWNIPALPVKRRQRRVVKRKRS